jgi:cobalamin biosynthesis protein CobW
MQNQKIPATVITGFLGAGKTTLIRNLLQTAEGKRIALIINEFGDLGVDGDVLKGCGIETCTEDDVVELTNGCICCTVADDFVPTMKDLLERNPRPDHIVIETSGLALPQPLVNAFNWPEIRENVTVDGVVTVVDGAAVKDGQFASNVAAVEAQRQADEALDHESPLEELFADQITCADMIVISKSDLLDATALADVEKTVSEKTARNMRFIHSKMDALPSAKLLLGLGVGSEADMKARLSRHEAEHEAEHEAAHKKAHEDGVEHDHHLDGHHHHHHHHHHHDHDHDEFESFMVAGGAITDIDGFKATLKQIIEDHQILRLKGFVEVANKPMRLVVQCVGSRIEAYFDQDWGSETPKSQLVVIGLEGLKQSQIDAEIKAICK